MMRPENRFATVLLAAGAVVLLAAIALGEHMGDRVMTEAVSSGNLGTTTLVTPVPTASPGPGGPDLRSSSTLSAAPDPHFPDPRIPPKPLPTVERPPAPSPTPTWTPNPNLPIWDQTANPSPAPSSTTFSEESTQTTAPEPTPTPG
ncbi:MAG TPA: hypothetical protein VMA98_04865 [Candidatus Acidoferrales bacterium]|nr:hypothetical protein [Candidatus Acidoferrales bacterium]